RFLFEHDPFRNRPHPFWIMLYHGGRPVQAARGSSLPAARVLAQRGLGGRKPRDWNTERRAGNVIKTDLMKERNRGRIAAVLAADADLEVIARRAAALDADPHQLADAFTIDRDERIGREDAALRIGAQEARRIVTADAERRLRQIVGTEREELRRL